MSDLEYRGQLESCDHISNPTSCENCQGEEKKRGLCENTVTALLKYQIEIRKVTIHVRLKTVSDA